MERRNFLKMLGVGAAVAAAPKVAQPDPEPITATLEEMDGVPWSPPTFSMNRWDGTYGLVACTSMAWDPEVAS